LHFSNKFYFLVNAKTISAAEGIMSAISDLNLGTIIGEQTAGINGNINSFRLEAGYEIIFTGLKATRYDGSRFHGIGIIPNQLVFPTVNGIINNQDDILENTIKIIMNGK
jgi:C-terminal processing protease CtpA/Prc